MPLHDHSTEFTFSFRTLKLTAKGLVAYVLAFGVTAVLLASALRIATGDFASIQTAVARGLSHLSGASKNTMEAARE